MSFIAQGKSNLKYILIVAILAAIVGGGVLAYQYWWLPKHETKQPEITTNLSVKVSATEGWQTYESALGGWEIKFPSDYNILELIPTGQTSLNKVVGDKVILGYDSLTMALSFSTSTSSLLLFQINPPEKKYPNVNFFDYVKEQSQLLQADSYNKPKVLKIHDEVVLNDHKMVKVDILQQIDGTYVDYYFVEKDDVSNTYIEIYVFKLNLEEANKRTAEITQILSTFKFIPRQGSGQVESDKPTQKSACEMKDFCETVTDCKYIRYTGGCYNQTYQAECMKELNQKGIYPAEAPFRTGVTCMCENNKCATDILLYEKKSSWGPCANPEGGCFLNMYVYSSGRVVLESKTTSEKKLSQETIENIIKEIRNSGVMDKNCSAPAVVDYWATYTINLDNKTKAVTFPGCEEETRKIDQMIGTAIGQTI